MIGKILDLLALDEFYGGTEAIEIAKGKYELKKTIKEGYEQGKRIAHGTDKRSN